MLAEDNNDNSSSNSGITPHKEAELEAEPSAGTGTNSNSGGGSSSSDKKSIAKDIVNSYFSPEFINRLDEVLIFNPLSHETIQNIAKIQLKKLKLLLLEEKNITLMLDHNCEKWLAHHGYDRNFGARPLKRLIQSQVLNPLATMILDDKIYPGDTVHVVAPHDTQLTNKNDIEDILIALKNDSDIIELHLADVDRHTGGSKLRFFCKHNNR